MIVWENNLVFLNVFYFKHEHKKNTAKTTKHPKTYSEAV